MNLSYFKISLIFAILLPVLSYGSDKCVRIFDKPPYIKVEDNNIKKNTPPLFTRIKGHTINLSELPSYMDHTLLKPDATEMDIQKLVSEALQFNFKAVCINACRIPFVKELLQEKEEKPLIATVIGFPLGAQSTPSKVYEAMEAYGKGANELDMVINIGYIKEDNLKAAESDIRQVVESTPLPVKVILETGLLTKEEIVIAAQIAEAAGAHFVKTSTGFVSEGARVEDIKLIKQSISQDMKIKASGGIRNLDTVFQMLVAGAHRLGLSSSVEIMKSIPKVIYSTPEQNKE